MRKMTLALTLIWISGVGLTGCTSSKARVFGEDMPIMKAIHDEKFSNAGSTMLDKPLRRIDDPAIDLDSEFMWLPNPTLTMYVFPHLTPAGLPVPGYSTYFRLYTQDHIAQPGERAGWD